MGIRRYCDRCKATINPSSSYTRITVWSSENGGQNYDLCVSCGFKLKKFLEAEAEEQEI